MPRKPDSAEVLKTHFTKPVKGYQKIECILGSEPVLDPCYKVCGFACAKGGINEMSRCLGRVLICLEK